MIISVNTVIDNSEGIDLVNSNNNTISGNIANYNDVGIRLNDYSNNNTISGNTANYNDYGIRLDSSNFNIVSGNILIGNRECIYELFCEGNIFENNDCGGEEIVIILISIISAAAIIGVAVVLLHKRKRARR